MGASRGRTAIAGILVVAFVSGLVLAAPAATAQTAPPAPRGENIDGLFARVAQVVPDFAGMYIDDRPRKLLYVRVKGGDAGSARRAALMLRAALFAQEGNLGALRVQDAPFSFLELKRWYDQLFPVVMAVEGVTNSDIDERLGTLDVGVSTAEAQEAVGRLVADLGVPAEAVAFHTEQPAVKRNSLRDRHRPLVGGLQVEFGGGSLCTLGIPVTRGAVSGYVTNSHCSSVEAGPDTTVHHQHTGSGSINRIGVEAADPAYFIGGACPPTYRCRYSDASFFRKDAAVTSSRGRIARPVVGSYFWNTANLYQVSVEANYGVVGRTVYKVGRTTGRTQGSISDTCVDYKFESLKVILLCQEKTNLKSLGGDSGSAVFRITNSPNPNDVTLYGLMWGGPTDNETYYSSWGWAVEDGATELGAMCAKPVC